MRIILVSLILLLFSGNIYSQEVKYNTIGAENPIIPGYFADPTIQKFGDTYYLYATTDGNGGGKGPSQVWTSKDFVNWSIQPMNWPSTPFVWAPDVMKLNNKYYMYYCQPCQIYCGVSDSPVGPWENILGEDEAVLVPDRYVKMSITLDGQTFIDDDGSCYLYWGTWGIYPNHGCGVGKFNPDMKTFSDTTLIPHTQAIDFFEAPFVFKRNGIYYFTYSSGSCHDHTYRVQYATSMVGPMGPFDFADNNPILETNADGTIHGPGHHSILQEGDDYYIVYHRHDIPNSTRGMHRQIAVDKLTFDSDGRIEKVMATHQGVGYLQKNTNPYPNLALGKKIKASSYYNENSKPEYAIDDNNATLWRPKTTGREWIEIDLEKQTDIRRIWTQFEYPTSFYQYVIETSKDGERWETFADRSRNTQAGSPMIDSGKAKARYIRLTVTGAERNGQRGSIWNIKVFNKGKDSETITASFNGQSANAAPERKGLIFDINADDYSMDEPISRIINRTDKLQGFNAYGSKMPVRLKDGKSAFYFNGMQDFRSDFPLPQTFTGSGSYTLMTWIYMETLSANEFLADLTTAGGELEKISLGYGTDPRTGIICHNGGYEDMGIDNLTAPGKWQFLAVTYDGYMEKIYLDGKLIKEKDIVLRLPKSNHITLGRRNGEKQGFKNCMHSLTLYDIALEEKDVKSYYEQSIPDSPYKMKMREMNDLKKIDSTPYIELVSPSAVRIGLKMSANEYGLSFLFENLTTKENSGWTKNPEYMEFALHPNTKYKYLVKIKDTFGNIQATDELEIITSEDRFTFIHDNFSTQHSFNTNGVAGTIWSGLIGHNLDETNVEAASGDLIISSSHRNFRFRGKENGPFLYQEVTGDFLAEVEIKDFNGLKDRKGVANNEGGIMVRIENDETQGNEATLLYLGVFPYWDVGNMASILNERGLQQFFNKKSWNLDRFLQVEKKGDKFYFRTSPDGKNWEDIPNTPFTVNVEGDKKIKLGLYQATYTENEGYVSFDNFKCWQPITKNVTKE